jgi:Domain of unknown function (DUF4149)
MARLQVFLAALWWGSLCAVGFMVVPMLFVHLETPAMAGQMAAKLFTAQSWLSIVCGVLLLAAQRSIPDRAHAPSPWVIGGMLCALLIEVAVKPHIVARDNMALWHNLGTALYLVQGLCAGKTLWDCCAVRHEQAVVASSTAHD